MPNQLGCTVPFQFRKSNDGKDWKFSTQHE